MIPESIMGRVAHSAGIQDRWLVTLDVLSVYLLQRLNETGMLSHMCFKGGISLRKVFARIPSNFHAMLILLTHPINSFLTRVYPPKSTITSSLMRSTAKPYMIFSGG